MKIAEKGGYKRICSFYFRTVLWVIIILPAVGLFYGGIQRGIELLISCILFSMSIWILITVFYWIFFFVTTPLRKKKRHLQLDSEINVEKKTINKESKKVRCKGCDKLLPQAQVDFMIGNQEYNKWCREGFCSHTCFEQYRHDNNKGKSKRIVSNTEKTKPKDE